MILPERIVTQNSIFVNTIHLRSGFFQNKSAVQFMYYALILYGTFLSYHDQPLSIQSFSRDRSFFQLDGYFTSVTVPNKSQYPL